VFVTEARCVLCGAGTEFCIFFTYMRFRELKTLHVVIILTSAKAIMRVSDDFGECGVG
jgi:hypothetical protein